MSAKDRQAYNEASWWDIGVLSMGIYMVWVVLYYLKVFVLSAGVIKERGYVTLFTYMMKNKKSLFARVVLSAPEKLQPVVYMGVHVVLVWIATLTAKFWWESKTAHTVFLILCASMSAWNGATYYFDIFSRKYMQQIGLQAAKSEARKQE
jgi:formate-dependent nitrite reductase membrane component NrfD